MGQKTKNRSSDSTESETTSYDSDAITMGKAGPDTDQDAHQNDLRQNEIRTNSEDSEQVFSCCFF